MKVSVRIQQKRDARWLAIRRQLVVPTNWNPDCSTIARKLKLPVSTVWDQWKRNESTIREEVFSSEAREDVEWMRRHS